MYKPRMKRPAIFLIIIHVILFFGGYKVFEGMPWYQIPGEVFRNVVGLFIKVHEQAETFEPFSEQDRVVVFLCIVSLIALSVWTIKTDGWKKFIREAKRMFNSRIPPFEYDAINESYKGNILIKAKELKEYERAIKDACFKSGFKEAIFKYNYKKDSDVETEEIENYIPTIEIGRGFLDRIQFLGKAKEKLLEFAIAHELSHVRHNDPINLLWTSAVAIILWLDGFALIAYSIRYLSTIGVLLLVAWVIFFLPFMNPMLWSRCFELRADREALDALRISGNDMFDLLEMVYPEMPEPEGKRNILLGIYRYVNNEDIETTSHPNILERRREAFKVKKWTLIQYLLFGFRHQRLVIERLCRDD